MNARWIAALLVAGLAASAAPAQDKGKTLIINDFESDADLKAVDLKGSPKLVEEGVTHGKKALELTITPAAAASLNMDKPPADWSPYDALMLDVFNPGDSPIAAEVVICDKAWQGKPTYWNRHNGSAAFGPGKTTWTVPVQGLYRGEAGSRNNEIKTDIDPAGIVRMYFIFSSKTPAMVIIDNLRLVKAERPKGVWAFDFGPASQGVQLGWTAVSNKTRYDAKQAYGLGSPVADTFARDTTFGPPLLRDFVECGGNTFRVDVPEGKYSVTVFYENSGYWDGEQAQQKVRTIQVDGKQAWKDERPDGSAHSLWRFENVEPVGVDIWDTYMAPELAKPAVFEAEAGKDGLTLKFEADRPWGSRVAGLALYKVGDAEAAAWVKGQLEELAKEFRGMAVCLDKPAPKVDYPPEGFIQWPVRLEETVTPNSVPEQSRLPARSGLLSRFAALGEYEPFCLAIRPGKDLGECKLKLEGGSPDVDAQIGVVWYGLSRGFGTIAYNVVPHTLRQQSTVNLPKDITREIIVTCHVSDKAKAGNVNWTLVVEDASGKAVLQAPLKLTVHAIKPDRDTDYCMGFFGMSPPGQLPQDRQIATMDQTLRLLSEHAMNALSGAASFQYKGFKDGQPVIDFADMDAFVAMGRKHGFTKGINAYGGSHLTGVNDGYEIGQTGKKLAADAGMPFEQALIKVWKAVDEHARKADWPLLFYVICDETRVRERAERELEFMNAMAAVTKEFPKTVRTSGAYSVNFNTRPTDKNDLLYWHQRFFEALDISSLNAHDESVMAEAAKLGKQIHIYNQGVTRDSFGIYQWSEYRKGVRARWQWHLTVMHGYQFFDLDGREPDSQAICYGRKGIIPTVYFERCRQGAQDFYLYNTLWKLTQSPSAGTNDARNKAAALLDDTVGKMKIGKRQAPDGFDADAFKARVIAAIEALSATK
ncbi:MAG: hypothetical protein ACE15C_13670 [Phycisphaerae bacterium]